MSKFSNYNLMRLAETDSEDAFDIIDFDREYIDEIINSATQSFIEEYKAYYDDVKTSKNVYKEDW